MISFADIFNETSSELDAAIKTYLQRIAKKHQISLETNISSGQMLRDLVQELALTAPVVLLIDEYDYAILKHIHDTPVADQMREILKNFYGVIKGLDRYLKFVF